MEACEIQASLGFAQFGIVQAVEPVLGDGIVGCGAEMGARSGRRALLAAGRRQCAKSRSSEDPTREFH